MLKTAAAKLLGAKLITVTAAATIATGGVALAAATNTLPDQAQDVAHDLVNAPAPRQDGSTGQAEQEGRPEAKPSHAPKATPSPSLRGLCTAYQAGATGNDGKALTNPAFTALVTAAGGTDKVAAYCTKLVGAPSTHATGKPTALPTRANTAHPTGKPSAVPTGMPTGVPTAAHPTGSPSTHPGQR